MAHVHKKQSGDILVKKTEMWSRTEVLGISISLKNVEEYAKELWQIQPWWNTLNGLPALEGDGT